MQVADLSASLVVYSWQSESAVGCECGLEGQAGRRRRKGERLLAVRRPHSEVAAGIDDASFFLGTHLSSLLNREVPQIEHGALLTLLGERVL